MATARQNSVICDTDGMESIQEGRDDQHDIETDADVIFEEAEPKGVHAIPTTPDNGKLAVGGSHHTIQNSSNIQQKDHNPLQGGGDVWLEEPEHLRPPEQYDILFLSRHEDLDEVNQFIDTYLKKLESENKLRIFIWEERLKAGVYFEDFDEAMKHCTYIFLYVTRQLCKNLLAQRAAYVALWESIQDPIKRSSIVPIFTDKNENMTKDVPSSIRSIYGFELPKMDKYSIKRLNNLLLTKINEKDKRGKKLDKDYQEKLEKHTFDQNMTKRNEEHRQLFKSNKRQHELKITKEYQRRELEKQKEEFEREKRHFGLTEDNENDAKNIIDVLEKSNVQPPEDNDSSDSGHSSLTTTNTTTTIIPASTHMGIQTSVEDSTQYATTSMTITSNTPSDLSNQLNSALTINQPHQAKLQTEDIFSDESQDKSCTVPISVQDASLSSNNDPQLAAQATATQGFGGARPKEFKQTSKDKRWNTGAGFVGEDHGDRTANQAEHKNTNDVINEEMEFHPQVDSNLSQESIQPLSDALHRAVLATLIPIPNVDQSTVCDIMQSSNTINTGDAAAIPIPITVETIGQSLPGSLQSTIPKEVDIAESLEIDGDTSLPTYTSQSFKEINPVYESLSQGDQVQHNSSTNEAARSRPKFNVTQRKRPIQISRDFIESGLNSITVLPPKFWSTPGTPSKGTPDRDDPMPLGIKRRDSISSTCSLPAWPTYMPKSSKLYRKLSHRHHSRSNLGLDQISEDTKEDGIMLRYARQYYEAKLKLHTELAED